MRRLRPELRCGFAAWILSMADKYAAVVHGLRSPKVRKATSGGQATYDHAQWALSVLTDLVNRLGEYVPSDTYEKYVRLVADQWGLPAAPQTTTPVVWEQPLLFE
jgi:predicted HAD superfamily phosphohydrolase